MLRARLHFVVEELPEHLDREVPVFHPAHVGEELVRQDRDVGVLEAGRREDVDDLVAHDGLRDDLADGVIDVARALPVPRLRLGDRRAYGLEEADVIANADRLVVWHCERKRLRELGDDLVQPLLAALLGEHVLLRRG